MNNAPPPPADIICLDASKHLFRTFDWTTTPIGPMAQWPPFLKAASDIINASATPMAIRWGRDGILIYNAAYAGIARGRHPAILGQKAMDAWPEVAEHNQRVMETCFAGQSLSIRGGHLVLQRHGYDEDVWLNVDYSPLFERDGEIVGVLAVANEVTDRVHADRRRTEVETQLAIAIESADFRRQIHPDDLAAHAKAYEAALDPASGGRYEAEFRVIDAAEGVTHWLATMGRAYFDEQSTAVRMAGTTLDITARKNAERRQLCLVELGDRLRVAETTAEIAQIAAEISARALNGSRAGYAIIENDVAYVEADWTSGESVSLVGPRLFGTLGDPFCDPLRAGQHLVINDVTTHWATKHNPGPFLKIRMWALVNVPLLENGVLRAVFYVHQSAPRMWEESEVRLLRDIGDRTWEAVCRARSSQRLRALNETLEQEVAMRTVQRDRMWRLSSDVMLLAAFDGTIQSVNPAWKTVLGWREDELIGRNLFDLTYLDDRDAARRAMSALAGPQTPVSFETRHRRKDGAYRWISWRAVPDESCIHAVGRDITPEREQAEALAAAEAALRQAQKMEAVGQLTGGIAHDFNNLLQGIAGSLEMAEKRLSDGRIAEVEKFNTAAKASASRAIALTQRLLAFSRRQPLDSRPVQANDMVTSMDDLLRRTMGEQIEVVLRLAPDLSLALCDPHQLESAVLNLAINARDAMPNGGRLVIETGNIHIGPAARPDLAPGPYVCLKVTDTGTGMPASVIEQAFEPFYTTKPLGQGTGLGLSMIYGFIRQSEGDVRIESEVGHGTSVILCLPRFMGELPGPADRAPAPVNLGPARHATVLVVEDELIVRELVLEVLAELGLSSISADNGPAGLEILSSKQHVDLLITDIGLPGLNGRQMADAARLLRPTLKILFMTGYAETAIMGPGSLAMGMQIIAKPFQIAVFAERVRSMVEAE
jgi:PAS domain S-box-containing protein